MTRPRPFWVWILDALRTEAQEGQKLWRPLSGEECKITTVSRKQGAK